MVNAHWEDHVFALPVIPWEMKWHVAFDARGTSYSPGEERATDEKERMEIPARTVVILTAYAD